MIYVFNDNAIFAAAVGVACGFGMYSYSRNVSAGAFLGAVCLIGFDLFLRLRNQSEDAPLLAPNAGGHIWFAPISIIGLVLTAIDAMFWLGWL
jgi:hypothetical protein